MKKFVVLYTSNMSAEENMQKGSEQMKEVMDAWMAWADKHKEALVDLGNPLGSGKVVKVDGVTNAEVKVAGYSLMQSESMESVLECLKEHPHLQMPTGGIEVYECLPM
jgi:enamine deaminase RidA (YjgF/YER057c/UK114 family)